MITNLTLAEFDTILRNDLGRFTERCFRELSPATTFSPSPHLEVMASRLSSAIAGGKRRFIVCLPPRSLKSITVSVALPAWLLGKDPTKHIICASYGQDLANKHARDCRKIMSSPFYRRVFPATKLSPNRLAVHDFSTTAGGTRMATSVGGPVTGRGGDIIIIDDPLKASDDVSEVKRPAVNLWYDGTVLSRLNNQETGIVIIVMQRLHQDDLIGHALELGEWEILSFPAIAEVDEEYSFPTLFGPKIYRRSIGDVLDPVRQSLKSLAETRERLGTYRFESQYQQNPVPVGGAMVKTEWLHYYEPGAPLPRFSSITQSWDTANKSTDLHDYSVCTTWGYLNGCYYLLDVFRQRMDYPELKRSVLSQIEKYKPTTVLIEDQASGTQLIQEMKALGKYCVKPYKPPPQSDKIMRFHTQEAKFESGKVFLPSTASWLKEYVREITTFPGTKYDDQVDSTSQALDYLSRYSSLDQWTALGRMARLGL
jgi:predicted phage terminase large subunit-like protein